MKIAYIKVSPTIMATDGIKIQAQTWGKELMRRGHTVDFINMWDNVDWKSYDIIHLFDYSEWMEDFIFWMKDVNPNIVISPIIDSMYSKFLFKLVSMWGSRKLRLRSRYYSLRQCRNYIKMYFVRSKYERAFITQSYGVEEKRIKIVPLSYRMVSEDTGIAKENFCLHVSLLADKRKNVEKLISASKKYGFNLKLAGKLRNEQEIKWLNGLISDTPQIEYLGFVTDRELEELYHRAKVFALPSIYEGVGMVALEAAVMGDDIVITNQGGPKEYYSNMAEIVNPNSVDEIGNAILKLLNGKTNQPQLKQHVISNYSLSLTCDLLENAYEKIVNIHHEG